MEQKSRRMSSASQDNYVFLLGEFQVVFPTSWGFEVRKIIRDDPSIPCRATEDEKESGASSWKASVDLVPDEPMLESSREKPVIALMPTEGDRY